MGSLSLDGTASDEHVDRILTIVRDVLSTSGVAADDDLADHGGTSLSIVRIVAEASRTLDLDIDLRGLGPVVTARNLARAARGTGEQP